MTKKCIVATRLPHAGLGNMLLVWARAVVFSELNSLPMIAPNWNALHIGPWLRGERCKRYYGSFFSDRSYKTQLQYIVSSIGTKKYIHYNPMIEKIDQNSDEFESDGQHIFMFDEMPPWNDYFQDLKKYQLLVKQRLYSDIHPSLLEKILSLPAPDIGIHIRRGDYQKPHPSDDFSIKRYVYTDLNWYIETLKSIRSLAKTDVPATVFSDGHPEDLVDILSLPNVSISTETSAISDLITMSRSKLLIGSAHSSFSAWACYLSQCPTLWCTERAHLYQSIFTTNTQQLTYEGGFDPINTSIPALLKANIHDLFTF
jgi:hypothetical protein